MIASMSSCSATASQAARWPTLLLFAFIVSNATPSVLGSSVLRSGASLRAAATDESASSFTSDAGAVAGSWAPKFFAPQLTPTQFLFISSPSLKKVVYTELKNLKSSYGRTYALIDSGLEQPSGLAFDRDRGHLYVADLLAQSIFRYNILVQKDYKRDGEAIWSLATDGIRLTILAGHNVEWVAVDRDGNVFYSDQGSKSINKITREVMDQLGEGTFQAESLQLVSEKALEASQSALLTDSMSAVGPTVTDPPAATPSILSIYESTINPHVTVPAGLATDGLRLYWANQVDGTTGGSCVQGEVNPQAPPVLAEGSDPQPFPATVLSNATSASYGMAKTSNMVFFAAQSGTVYGVQATGGDTTPFVSSLGQPRGLAWDGDNTIFVADETGNAVYSFPTGRVMSNVPLTKTVDFQGAYGLAVLSMTDKAFQLRASSPRRFATGRPFLGAALAMIVLALASLPMANS